MIVHEMEQRTPEWFAVKANIASASMFDQILTPKKRDPSKSRFGYMNQLLANWLTGGTEEVSFISEHMQHGIDTEDEAVAWYEMNVAEVRRVGFCVRDDRLGGCSPDALVVGQEKGLEIKCPKASVHMQYLLGQTLPTAYIMQVQGSMWVTGYPRWDFLSYHPDFNDQLLITVERDEQYMAALQLVMLGFNNEMQDRRDSLLALGYAPKGV